jgi:lysophospholipase L1-like esterase
MLVLNRKYPTALVAAVIATMMVAPSVGAEPAKQFQSETPTPRVDYWQKREADIVTQIADTKDLSVVKLVFIGDSITDFWHLDENPWFKGKWMGKPVWDESFGETATKNRAINIGVSGDRIEHVLYRLTSKTDGGMGVLDRADLQPEFLVIMLGINNTFDGEEPLADSLFQGVRTAVDTAHKAKPGAKIILQSILPTDDPVKNAKTVIAVNERLADLIAQPEYAAFATYLDLYSSFVDASGAQRKEFFVDGLHPGRDGYSVWRDRLIETLARARAG